MRRWGWAAGLALFGFLWLAPAARAQVSLPLEGKGSVAGNSGAFTYSIPIEVPPGRRGLTPQLGLTYNSSAGNGFLGVGWDLPIGYIMRSTKYGVDYNCQPAVSPNPCYVFMMGGASSELIPRPDWCSDCYGAKIEGGFMRFRWVNGMYWEATDKSGTKYLLGQAAASRQDGAPGVFKWMLDTVTDTHNNTISYSYFKDQGEIYIDRVNYQSNAILFYREVRSDAPTLYTSNFAVTTAYRLSAIDVWANGTRLRKYGLAYCGAGASCPASGTGRSLLGSITQYGSDGATALPANTFGWQAGGNGFGATYTSDVLDWGYNEGRAWVDVNGDGKADYCRVAGNSTAGYYLLCTLSTGTGFGATYWSGAIDAGYPDKRWWVDFDGDGKADYCRGVGGSTTGVDTSISCTLSTGTGFGATYNSGALDWGYAEGRQWVDVNGDGKADYCRVAGANTDTYVLCTLAASPISDLLTFITNGIGGRTDVAYQPSSAYWSSSAAWNLPFVAQNVSSITVCDNYNSSSCIGNATTTNYAYSGGYYNAANREFRGYSYVKAANLNSGVTTETWYHQGNGTGPAADSGGDSPGYMASRPYQIDVKDSGGVLRSRKTLTYWADVDGASPWFTPLQQEDNSACDPSGACKQTGAVYTYDDRYSNYSGVYGNLTREELYGDIATTVDDKTLLRGFSPNSASWIVGLPSYENVYAGIPQGTMAASTVYHYDATGNLTQIGRWYDRGGAGTGCDNLAGTGTCLYTTMAYDGYGNILTTTDANSHTTTLCYDASATFPQTATNALNQVVKTDYYDVAWNAACGSAPTAYTGAGLYGQIKSVTDANGQQATSTYDVFGRKSQVNAPDGSWTSWVYPCVTSSGCADGANLFGVIGSQYIKTNTAVGLSSWTYFDGLGRAITEKKTGPDGKIIRVNTHYNRLGQITDVSFPYFDGGAASGYTYYWYDSIGRQSQINGQDAAATRFCYSLWSVATIDPNNHMRRETKDAYGRLVQVDEYTGNYTDCPATYPAAYATTTYQYNPLGNLLSVTDAAGNITTMNYDSLSRKYGMTDPDMGTWSYIYDSVGNLTQQTDAKGQNIFFQYDALNRLVQKDYATQKTLGSGDVRYIFDISPGWSSYSVGRLTQVIDSSGTAKFGYDSMGRINRTDKIVDLVTYTIQTGYDLGGRVQSVTYPDNDVVYYSYNGSLLGQVYKDGASYYAQYAGYNPFGQPATITYGNAVSTNFTYFNLADADSNCHVQNFRLCKITTTQSTSTYQSLRYSYDTAGNVNNITDSISTGGLHVNQNQTFVYDELNRITSAIGPYGALTYAYNAIGNLLCNSAISSCTSSTPNYTYGDAAHKHAATNAGGSFPMSYDANGNMTGHASDALTYDMENRVSSLANVSGTTSFIYDGDGGRVKKINGGVAMIYIGKLFECAAPCSVNGVWSGTKHIFAGSIRIASKPITTTGDIFYYHPDRLGSASVITDKNGADYSEFVYYPFGDTYSMTGIDINYKYTGQLKDVETGLYFYGARYYDARVGRFISPDSIMPGPRNPQNLNRYSYTVNSPINLIDPTGHTFTQTCTVNDQVVPCTGDTPPPPPPNPTLPSNPPPPCKTNCAPPPAPSPLNPPQPGSGPIIYTFMPPPTYNYSGPSTFSPFALSCSAGAYCKDYFVPPNTRIEVNGYAVTVGQYGALFRDLAGNGQGLTVSFTTPVGGFRSCIDPGCNPSIGIGVPRTGQPLLSYGMTGFGRAGLSVWIDPISGDAFYQVSAATLTGSYTILLPYNTGGTYSFDYRPDPSLVISGTIPGVPWEMQGTITMTFNVTTNVEPITMVMPETFEP